MEINQFDVGASDGGRLIVKTAGPADGAPVVLMHGFLLDHTIWLEVVEKVRGRWRFILPDTRGHGMSEAPRSSISMSDLADDVLRIVDSLGIDQPFVLGGHSFGGIISMECVRLRPEATRALVLCGARPNAEGESGRAFWSALARDVMDRGAGVAVEWFRDIAFADSFDKHAREAWINRMTRTSSAGIARCGGALATRPDQWNTLRRYAKPTLIVFGRDDRATPPEIGIEIASAMPHANLKIIDGCGHVSPVESPGAFAQILQKFLDGLEP